MDWRHWFRDWLADPPSCTPGRKEWREKFSGEEVDALDIDLPESDVEDNDEEEERRRNKRKV